jgi:hypothetical protein
MNLMRGSKGSKAKAAVEYEREGLTAKDRTSTQQAIGCYLGVNENWVDSIPTALMAY